LGDQDRGRCVLEHEAQILLAAAQLLLLLLALRDVAQDDGEHLAALRLGLRDRRVDRELAAIRAQAHDRPCTAHRATRDAGLAEAIDVAAMRAAEALRDE